MPAWELLTVKVEEVFQFECYSTRTTSQNHSKTTQPGAVKDILIQKVRREASVKKVVIDWK